MVVIFLLTVHTNKKEFDCYMVRIVKLYMLTY